MGDMLSQAEIDALLGGASASTATEEPSDLINSEEEITEDVNSEEANPAETAGKEKKTKTSGTKKTSAKKPSTEKADDKEEIPPIEDPLTDYQKDILGEIGNISMGTSATTLFALLGQKVLITTPKVSVMNWKQLSKGYDRPCVGIRVDYIEGIEGSNVMILKEKDVKIITSLMMGGDGVSDIEGEINEIDLSAIGEAMNQMIGSSSTSLSSLIKMRIDIDTPNAFLLDFNNENNFTNNTAFKEDLVVCIKFRMQIGSLIDSEIMQLLPIQFALTIIETMENDLFGGAKPKSEPVQMPTQQTQVQPPPQQQAPPPARQQEAPPVYEQPSAQDMYQPPVDTRPAKQNVNVQPVSFQSFDTQVYMQQKENIDIVMDVPLEVTVELGRTNLRIKEIMEFTPGKIIELDKIIGEPIDILVNGKFVAKGEIVVIEDNFCVRITDLVSEVTRTK